MSADELAKINEEIDSAIDEHLLDELEPEPNAGDETPDEDENQVDNEQDEQKPVDKPTEDSEIEKAKANGWNPDYDGPDKIGAAEFNRRAPLFEKISAQNRKLKDLERQVNALANHTKTVEQKTREKVLNELKNKQREAVETGDTDAFDKAEEQIKALDEDEGFKEPVQPEIPKPIQDFAARNEWFEKDEDMTTFAVAKVQTLAAQGVPLEKALEMAETKVKELFPQKFKTPENPNKSKPQRTMSGNNQQSSNKMTMASLTPEQKHVWYALKGTMTEKEFLDQLESIA